MPNPANSQREDGSSGRKWAVYVYMQAWVDAALMRVCQPCVCEKASMRARLWNSCSRADP